MQTREMWRVPDQLVGSDWTKNAVWYDLNGPDGDHATELDWDGSGFVVSEYTNCVGLIDDLDPDFPFLKTTTYVDESETGEYLIAVAIGVDRLAHDGGKETFVESLP